MKILKANQITSSIPTLSQEERKELDTLSFELFGALPPVIVTPDLPKQKVERYKFLAKKQMECMKALLN